MQDTQINVYTIGTRRYKMYIMTHGNFGTFMNKRLMNVEKELH